MGHGTADIRIVIVNANRTNCIAIVPHRHCSDAIMDTAPLCPYNAERTA